MIKIQQTNNGISMLQLTVDCICGTVTRDKLLRMMCDIAVACSNIKQVRNFFLLLAS